MKLNLPALFFLLTLASAQTFGQISITASDIWVIGDTIPRVLDTLTTFLPGPDGPNQFWDFSGAIPRVYQTTKVMTPVATPFASSFPTSNQAMTTNDSLYLYFNTSASSVYAKGTAGMGVLNATVTNFNFSLNPDLLTDTFPINYGNHYTDTYGYDAIVDGAAYGVYQLRLKHFGTVYDTITGWGAIKTNTGTYDCLKQKIIEHAIDTTWYKLFSFTGWTMVGATDDTTTSYSWLTRETKLAVAELTFDSLGNPKQFIWSLIAPLSTGVLKQENTKGITIYPNPASSGLSVHFSSAVIGEEYNLQIYDPIGKEVFVQSGIKSQTFDVNVSALKPGIYFVKLKSEKGITEQRFVKK